MIIAGLYWLVIGPEIALDYWPSITPRIKPTTFQNYNDINNDNKI